MAGRASKRTEPNAVTIFEAIRVGATRKRAAAIVGISQDTLARWEKQDADFAHRLIEAEAHRDRSLIVEIRTAAKRDWRAAAWLLERVAREDYGTPKIDVNLTVRQVQERAERIASDLGLSVEEVIAEAESIMAGVPRT